MRGLRRALLVGFVAALFSVPSFAAARDVQIRVVDFSTGIIELFNFGTTDELLDGYRFCTHNSTMIFLYSSRAGFNGFTVEAGTSLFVHFNNDSPGGPDHINRSTLGGQFATPLDPNAFSMSLFFPPLDFNNGNTMADHLQWSIGGIDDTTADERSDEAQSGGVWTDQSTWIATQNTTLRIILKDTTGQVLHGPSDYAVDECPCPMNYSAGLAGSGGIVPTISTSGGFARLGTTTFQIDGGQMLGGVHGLLLVGFGRAQLAFAGGNLLVDLTLPFQLIPLCAGGSLGVPGDGTIALPAQITDGLLIDSEVDAQFILLDSGASQGFAMSDAISFVVCNRLQ
jgi:hypothetical protein